MILMVNEGFCPTGGAKPSLENNYQKMIEFGLNEYLMIEFK